MNKLHSILVALALGTVPVVGAFAVRALLPVPAAVNSASSRLNGVLDGVNGTLVNVNRPCKGAASPDACGTLAQINKTSIAAGDIVNQSRIHVAQTGQLITAATANLNDVGSHVSTAVDALAGTARAATGAIDQAHTDLAAADTAIAAAKPLLDAATLTTQHVDDATERVDLFLKSPELVDDGVQVHGLLAHGNAIAGDAQIEADKLTHPDKKKLGFWGATAAAGNWLRHFMPPLF